MWTANESSVWSADLITVWRVVLYRLLFTTQSVKSWNIECSDTGTLFNNTSSRLPVATHLTCYIQNHFNKNQCIKRGILLQIYHDQISYTTYENNRRNGCDSV